MLNIFCLANIIKKLQLNIDKYNLFIYHITKSSTTTKFLRGRKVSDNKNNQNLNIPITTISSSSSSSATSLISLPLALSYPYHHKEDIYQKALSIYDLIICQIIPAAVAATLINSSSTTTASTKNLINSTDYYITELNYDYQQNEKNQKNYYYIKKKIRHQQQQEKHQQQQQKNQQENLYYKNICNNQKKFSRLLNFKESSCLIKYYNHNNNNNNNLYKLNKFIIIRKMSTIGTTPTPENSTKTITTPQSDGTTINNRDIIIYGNNDKIINNGETTIISSSNNTNGTTLNGGDSTDSKILNDKSSCFTSSLADIIQFLELVGGLKHTKRTGWVLRDIKDCESISGHMYRMSMMTFLLNGSEGLNQIRCMELALVHDLAESIVGDLTPFCGVSKEDKRKREMDAMENICNLIQPRGERMWKLFQEYEAAETPESKFVKDLDRLDLVLQAFEYEKRDNCVMKHQEFFDSNEGKFDHPFVKKLVNEIYEQRKQLADKLNATTEMYEQKHLNGHSSSNCISSSSGNNGECPEDLSQKKEVTTTS